MTKALSFEPVYHELTAGSAGTCWRPAYNPVRDCVKAEQAQIEAEGDLVNSKLWKQPRPTRESNVQLWCGLAKTIGAPLLFSALGLIAAYVAQLVFQT